MQEKLENSCCMLNLLSFEKRAHNSNRCLSLTQDSNQGTQSILLKNRTLVSIVVVFALSWFPLNLLNIILDVHNIFEVSNINL